jgi:hypothetical protein
MPGWLILQYLCGVFGCLLGLTAHASHSLPCFQDISALSPITTEFLRLATCTATPNFVVLSISDHESDIGSNDGRTIYVSPAYFPVQSMISLQSREDIPLCASIISSAQDVCPIHFALDRASLSSHQLAREGLCFRDEVEIESHGSWRAFGFVSSPGVEINGRIAYELFGLFYGTIDRTHQIISRRFYLGISEVPGSVSAEIAGLPRASGILSLKITIPPGSWRSIMTDGRRRRVHPPMAV